MEPHKEKPEEIEEIDEIDSGIDTDEGETVQLIEVGEPGEPGYYQKLMHNDNQRRMVQMEKNQARMARTLAAIHANTKGLPKLKEDVDSLKGSRNKVYGAMALVSGATPVITWLANRFIH